MRGGARARLRGKPGIWVVGVSRGVTTSASSTERPRYMTITDRGSARYARVVRQQQDCLSSRSSRRRRSSSRICTSSVTLREAVGLVGNRVLGRFEGKSQRDHDPLVACPTGELVAGRLRSVPMGRGSPPGSRASAARAGSSLWAVRLPFQMRALLGIDERVSHGEGWV